VDVKCITLLPRIIFTCKQGVQAAWECVPAKQTSRGTCHTSGTQGHSMAIPARDSGGIADTPFALDGSEKRGHRVHTSASGNPLLTMVHQSGIFTMEVLFCVCPNSGSRDEQLLHTGLFPSTIKQIETAFTFSVMDDFLLDNLECKTTAQQYFSKLQHITNRRFPGHVPVCHAIYKPMCLADGHCRTSINNFCGLPGNGET
jgi:hypothetical protein